MQRKDETKQILNKGKFVLMDSLDFNGAQSIHFLMNQVKIFEVSFSSRWLPCKCRASCQSFPFILKSNCIKIKLYIKGWDRLSVKTFQVERIPPISRETVWENDLSGSFSLDKETACLRILICLSCLFWSRLSSIRLPYKEEKMKIVQNV